MRNFYFLTFFTFILGSFDSSAQGPWTFTNDNEIWASTGTSCELDTLAMVMIYEHLKTLI